jgi:hypothetical protein
MKVGIYEKISNKDGGKLFPDGKVEVREFLCVFWFQRSKRAGKWEESSN